MKRGVFLAGAAAGALCLGFVPLATATDGAGPSPLKQSAIVKIHAAVPANARTAATLGREREGSGIVIDDSGLVVTIGYLILEAEAVRIETANGTAIPARTVAYDHETGFGLLRTLDRVNTSPIALGQSSDLEAGQQVLIASFDGSQPAQPALVVKRDTFAGYWEYLLENAIFTSPPHLQFGGAALIDGKGELVGVGSLILPNVTEHEGGAIPGNMFVPIDSLKPILADLITHGRAQRPSRPWLGLYSQFVRGRLFVGRVPRTGPAWMSGIRPGDLILGVGNEPVTSLADFYRKIWGLGEAGVEVPLQVLQGMTSRTLRVQSIDRREWLKLQTSY